MNGYTRSPKQVESLSGIAIEQVSCGDDFTCCVCSKGDLYTFGTDYMGCLGLGQANKYLDDNQSVYEPIQIPYFQLNGLKVARISCGESHCIALTHSNQIFTWGCGEHGRLGLGDEYERHEPTELSFKIKYKFKNVFAGGDCSFILTADGKVLVCGNNEYNKLCLNDNPVGFKLKGTFEKSIQVNALDAFDSKNKCWFLIKFLKGLNDTNQQLTPRLVKKLLNYTIVKVCPGRNHTAVIDNYGRLFTFGNNKSGELGVGDFKPRSGPNLISGALNGQHVINASCGDTFTVCCTAENHVFSWGNRKDGRLGLDSVFLEGNVSSPRPIFGSLHLVSDLR